MQRLLSIALTFAKVSTQRELSYRAEFAGNFVNAFGVDAFMAVVAVSVIFVHTDSLRGWSAGEMLAVVGIWYFVLGLMSMVMFPSLNQVVEDVHEGTFDYVLMKPVPSLFLASTRSFAAANSAFVLMGLSLALFGIFALEAGQVSWRIALFPVLLASGTGDLLRLPDRDDHPRILGGAPGQYREPVQRLLPNRPLPRGHLSGLD